MQWKLHKLKKRTPIEAKYVVDGSAMHIGMEAAVSGIPPDPVEAALKYFTMRVKEEAVRWSEDETRAHFLRVREGTEKMVQIVDELRPDGQLRSEVGLIHIGKGFSMEGILDLVVERTTEDWRQEIEIYDLKSGQWHHDQLVFYDLLWTLVMGRRPVKMGVIEPLSKGLVVTPVDESHLVDMKQRITVMARAVAAGEFTTDGYPNACGWCNSKPWCPEWDQVRDMRLEA